MMYSTSSFCMKFERNKVTNLAVSARRDILNREIEMLSHFSMTEIEKLSEILNCIDACAENDHIERIKIIGKEISLTFIYFQHIKAQFDQ